jgi:hypothetical protein
VFVFMGRLQPADSIDYDLILDDFDHLLPLYRFVEGKEKFPKLVQPVQGGFQFKPGCNLKPARTTGSLQERELDIVLRHNELQKALHDHLASLYGAGEVGTERDSAGGQVDVVVRRSPGFWFYEIKTAMSARACIRQALAQLLEYAYWPGAQEAYSPFVRPLAQGLKPGVGRGIRRHLRGVRGCTSNRLGAGDGLRWPVGRHF